MNRTVPAAATASVLARADLLLFEGDTRSGEADQTGTGAETG